MVITDVEQGSAAGRRGIFPGARILQINGRDVTDPEDVRSSLDAVRAGQIVSFVLETRTAAARS